MSLVPTKEYTSAEEVLAAYRARYAPKASVIPMALVRCVRPQATAPAVVEAPPVEPALEQGRVSARQILRDICKRHGLKISCVIGVRRHPPLVRCRQEAAWVIAKETSLSMPKIGSILNKDHTTILMAIRRQNEITGENVRGVGVIPEKTRQRNRMAASEKKLVPLSPGQRVRKCELARNRGDFRL